MNAIPRKISCKLIRFICTSHRQIQLTVFSHNVIAGENLGYNVEHSQLRVSPFLAHKTYLIDHGRAIHIAQGRRFHINVGYIVVSAVYSQRTIICDRGGVLQDDIEAVSRQRIIVDGIGHVEEVSGLRIGTEIHLR